MKTYRVIWAGEDMGEFQAESKHEAKLAAIREGGGGFDPSDPDDEDEMERLANDDTKWLVREVG